MSAWQHESFRATRVNPAPTELGSEPLAAGISPALNKLWLPAGVQNDLKIEHAPLLDGGSLTGGGWKLVWHTTESRWDEIDSMYSTLRDERFASHLLIGGRPGIKRPVVIQMVPFDRAARALEHPAGTLQTNRADAIQIEICGYASESAKWPEYRYEALAHLLGLIVTRRNIIPRIPIDFAHPHRMSPSQWIKTAGHVGHSMAPNQTQGHTDPGALRVQHILDLVAESKTAL
ncbi:MAG TPA: N-acetylmuramoyl-L-alanine amidase [Candidatus Saccharimonadales bacterium]|nr:N-acetylmuramoyl-L-alanine amidase [Candidatus Saccharimonadales bacterium]